MPAMKKWSEVNLDFDIPVVLVVITSTLLLMADNYFTLTPVKAFDRLVLFLIVPMVILLVGFRRKPSDFGFQLGDWQAGVWITLVSILLIAPLIWLVLRFSPEMQAYYQVSRMTLRFVVLAVLELMAWEFFFRGFMYFSYEEKFGDHALWLQAVPFAMAHITKPAVETFTTLFGGFLFALVARRTRSFLYPFLIHLFVALFTKFAAQSFL